MSWAAVNGSWWSGGELNVDLGQYRCDALRWLFFYDANSTGPSSSPSARLARISTSVRAKRVQSSLCADASCGPYRELQYSYIKILPTTSTDLTWFIRNNADITLEREKSVHCDCGKNSKDFLFGPLSDEYLWWMEMGDHEADWLGCAITFCWESRMRRDGCLPPRPRERASDL